MRVSGHFGAPCDNDKVSNDAPMALNEMAAFNRISKAFALFRE
jgi:hypothetical protein